MTQPGGPLFGFNTTNDGGMHLERAVDVSSGTVEQDQAIAEAGAAAFWLSDPLQPAGLDRSDPAYSGSGTAPICSSTANCSSVFHSSTILPSAMT